jgi:hypothetical protein
MPPGRYSVRLTANGLTLTQPLAVLEDPNEVETAADVRAATDALVALQNDHRTAGEMIGTIEHVRSQLESLGAHGGTPPDIRQAGDTLEQKFMNVEGQIVDLRLTGHGQDEVRYPVKEGGQISWLAGGISASDFAPTSQQREVQTILNKEVHDTRASLDRLLRVDLAAFNGLLKARGLRPIDTGGTTVF